MRKIDILSSAELFRGCVAPGRRMSEALLAFYGESERRLLRARCASGVRIALRTDSENLEFGYRFDGSARQIFTADVEVGGRHFQTVDGEGPHRIVLPAGEKDVVIHLPHLAVLREHTLALDAGASVKPLVPPARKLLICGDSIMQGMTCTTPSKAVGAQLAVALKTDFHNTSVGGAVMSGVAAEETLALGGDAIIVGFGINDAYTETPSDKFREETRRVLRALSAFSGKSFMVTPIPSTVVDADAAERCREIIREERKEHPAVTLIEGPEIFPADSGLFVDGTHPNDRGMTLYARALAGIMGPLLG